MDAAGPARARRPKWFRFLVGRLRDRSGVPIVVSRTGYTGELGFEVWCHPDDGTAVWDAVMEAGASTASRRSGMEALDMLRVESGLILAGHEFDQDTDPFEAGIGFTVALDTRRTSAGATRCASAASIRSAR